jgi:hypothetical protein
MARPSLVKKIRKLSIVPGRRYIDGRQVASRDDTLDRPTRNVAVAAHLRGTEAKRPCKCCSEAHRLHFERCIILAGYMNGRCTNCHWAIDHRSCVFPTSTAGVSQVVVPQYKPALDGAQHPTNTTLDIELLVPSSDRQGVVHSSILVLAKERSPELPPHTSSHTPKSFPAHESLTIATENGNNDANALQRPQKVRSPLCNSQFGRPASESSYEPSITPSNLEELIKARDPIRPFNCPRTERWVLSNYNWNGALAENLEDKPMRLYIDNPSIATPKMNSEEAEDYAWGLVIEIAGLEEEWLADVYSYMREKGQIGAEVEEMKSVITGLQNISKRLVGNIGIVGYNDNCVKSNIGQLRHILSQLTSKEGSKKREEEERFLKERWIKLKDLKAWTGSWISWLLNEDDPEVGYIAVEEYLKRLPKRFCWNNGRKLEDDTISISTFFQQLS